ALVQGVAVGIDGDGLQRAHRKADQAARQGADQRQQQGGASAPQVRYAVLLQQEGALVQKCGHGYSFGTSVETLRPGRMQQLGKTGPAQDGRDTDRGKTGLAPAGRQPWFRGWASMAWSIMAL